MDISDTNIVSTLDYNNTAVVLTSNHFVTTRLKQQDIQHKTKKKKARFFEQFCKYLHRLYSYKYLVIYCHYTSIL